MLSRHDWITPTLGGKPWLEKPVLYYWQAMVAYKLFGVSDWAARLPSAVDATLMVVAVFLFLRRFRPGIELDGALITASAAAVVGFARAAATDMPLASAFAIAMLAWYAWQESARKAFLVVFYIFLALATLAKGPVAPFLAGVILVAFAVAKGDWRLLFRTLWLPGILAFLLVSLPWYIAVQLRNPEFLRVFILEHNLSRFGTNRYHHTQAFWSYLPVAIIGLLPWVAFIGAALYESLRAWWAEKRDMAQSEDAFSIFLILWLALPIAFFSLSQSKLPGYILPALPAGALLLAEYLRSHAEGRQRPGLLMTALHSISAASLLLPPLALQFLVLQRRLPPPKTTLIFAAFVAFLAIAIAVTIRRPSGFRLLRFVTLVPVILAIAATLRLDARFLDDHYSARPLSEAIAHLDNGSLPTAVFGTRREVEFGLAFYRNQLISRYESGEVPAGEHILVAPHSMTTSQIGAQLPGRRISYLGTLGSQALDFYWVSATGMGGMRM
jgi:4-amino-4-deoxy-L-arabinose transferase-like glycosyltransferase